MCYAGGTNLLAKFDLNADSKGEINANYEEVLFDYSTAANASNPIFFDHQFDEYLDQTRGKFLSYPITK